jgi:SAM-dependent methyltransferase
MDRRRRRHGLPGLNSATLNKEIWESWDWSAQGEEWTWSPAWKESLIRCVLEAEIPADADVLEIGPGGGRWTEPLLARARKYIGVDISASCVEHCRSRFGGNSKATFTVGSGRDLAAAGDGSVDAIWSFDAFVHMNAPEVGAYVEEFVRVLRPGAIAVVHHGGVGGADGGWRSTLTDSAFKDLVLRCGLRVERSFDRWEHAGAVHTLAFGDRITVIRKPDTSATKAAAAA